MRVHICGTIVIRQLNDKWSSVAVVLQVDHFSRYGLPLDSDSDADECMADDDHDNEDFETPGVICL